MNFPIKSTNVKSHCVILALTIENKYSRELYARKYYRVIYKDNSEFVFLTTSEPSSQFENQFLDEDFTIIKNFKDMMDNFENQELKWCGIDTSFNSLPKYIYYDIITIDNSIKPLILDHLKDSIIGYTEIDFTKHEQIQLNKWMTAIGT